MECSYEYPWLYLDSPVDTEDLKDYFGFVYCITNTVNCKQYIGRKNIWSHRKIKGKSRRVKIESNWKKYWGSCKELKEDIELMGKENFKRNIISFHKTQGKLNYEETRLLFLNNVLIEKFEDGTEKYYNNNVANRYFKKDYFNYLD